MHHGGAGTTACGLRHGRPTIIVPFFGDQKFWGDSVHQAGAGPAPMPFKAMSEEGLAGALQSVQTEEVRAAAQALGERIREEKGEMRGAESFHRQLPMDDMRWVGSGKTRRGDMTMDVYGTRTGT
jgi:UDP:flavonoid glycosyltransferase YjiC (YdhE family)